MGVGAGEVGPGISAPAGGGGPGSPGTSTLRAFPFAFDTPGLVTAAALYTPTIGDILLDGWVEIDTAWNGTTPFGDISFGGSAGVFADNFLGAVDMTNQDAPYFGLSTAGNGYGSNPVGRGNVSVLEAAIGTLGVNAGAGVSMSRVVPGKFLNADPVKVVVSQNGTDSAGAAVVTSANPATVPLTVVAGVNDEFVFTGPALGVGGAGTPETFTVAPGTYSTLAALAAAMQAATGAVHLTFFNFTGSATGYEVSASGGTNLQVNAAANNVNGAGDNGDTITPGTHDFTAAAGFANPTTFGSGTGGDPGSTQGAGILYLLTATPL